MADSKLSALSEVSVPDFADDLYLVDDTGPTSYKVGADRLLGLLPHICTGRLTTESGVAVSTTDRTAQGTIYFAPYLGNSVGLYDGTRWRMYALTQRQLALTVTSGKNYDVFLYDNAGVLTLELSAAWTNDTTRADAIAFQDQIPCKSGALTRRWLGTIRASAANVTEDSAAKRFVWNAYNRVRRPLYVTDTTASWTYSTYAWRQARATAANRVECVVGGVESLIELDVEAVVGGAAGSYVSVSIGEDSTTAPAALAQVPYVGLPSTTNTFAMRSRLSALVPLGYHAYNWLEIGTGSGTQTWYGEATDTMLYSRPGLQGSIDG